MKTNEAIITEIAGRGYITEREICLRINMQLRRRDTRCVL